ncbi:MAG TPA: copper resistance protein CopC [Candidatus Thermoplasmatota archaeon]|nr:copper resistance protein CopC [Candidatus Thermoplasmatota archaeon]
MRYAGLVLLLALLAPLASAHAVLKSADPAPNARVPEGLTVVVIEFTEDVERQFTDGDVVDSTTGESWKSGPVQFDPDRRNVIRVPVRPLESGVYSASWKALSVDTHTTRGTFVFAVGDATLRPGGYDPIVDVQDPAAVTRDGFARFAFYAGLFLVAGMPLFALVVLRDPPPGALFSTAAAFGTVGAAGALVGLLLLADRTGLGLATARSGPGLSLVARGALVLAATLACAWAAWRPSSWRAASLVALLLGAGGVLATAAGSHAAAVRENTLLYVAADAVHLAAGAVWIGGIVAFLHVLWGRSPLEVSHLVHRFGFLAVPSVVLLLATGTLASAAHMPCVAEGAAACADALRSERYMQLVLAKLLLMAPLIALGAFNKYTVGPRLARGAWTPVRFRRVVQLEALLLAAILLAAGVLAASAPPTREAERAAPPAGPLEFQNFTSRSHIILQVTPNPVTVGVQKLVVVVHPLGPTLPNGTLVALKVWHESEREPETTINPTKVTPNEWEIEEAFFTSPGTWNVLIIVQRPDEYSRLTFQVPVQGAGGAPSGP